MPHSDDRTLITCAGDAEVRVFDIEYSGRSIIPSAASNVASSGRRRGFSNLYNGVRYLSDGDTKARVYRSHSDRVKRIVTESSPYLFLTCSEDGEVRQWDLRQPSSAYPAPRVGRGFSSRPVREHDNSTVPPPLISYKRYHLDLNTISCAASQPHYIALGGAHLHCFLHDRRMIGRDTLYERGQPGGAADIMSDQDDGAMGQATRCVKRFAPNGKSRMQRTDNGHITACKISDANPNEIIVSWSGEHIYSFDLVKSSDARDELQHQTKPLWRKNGKGKSRESKDRKRKRELANSSTSLEGAGRAGSRPRQENGAAEGDGELSLRVRYENGQSEEIPIDSPGPTVFEGPTDAREEARLAVLSESRKRSRRIAMAVVKIRKLMFSLDAASRASSSTSSTNSDPTLHTANFTSILGFAAAYLPEMDEIMREWRYPVNPLEEEVVFQQTLRRNRESSRRFLQANGALARVLGGKLRTAGQGQSPMLHMFDQIVPAPNESSVPQPSSLFSYDFLKAILLWLDGGRQALLQGFKRPSDQRNDNPRFPIPDATGMSAIDTVLIPYLLRLSGVRSIPNVDASRFDRDEYRTVFPTETNAVIAFGSAVNIPLEDLSRAIMPGPSVENGSPPTLADIGAQDRGAAIRFWGLRVGRGVLMNAGEGVNFAFVDRAFAGLGIPGNVDEERSQEDVDPEAEERVVDGVSLVRRSAPQMTDEEMEDINEGDSNAQTAALNERPQSPPPYSSGEATVNFDNDVVGSDEEVVRSHDLHSEVTAHVRDEDGDEDSDDVDEDSESESESDEGVTSQEGHFMFRSAFDRSKMREKVERGVPCFGHTRQYRGHCNVKTVKDVNFFGLQDEYVVSGSDSGHVFIWDKKTTQLVNILEGDGEVVNVVQGTARQASAIISASNRAAGHPYEPVLAVSGIDQTIKIFSPDARAQDDARAGINIATQGSSGLSHGRTRFHGRRSHADADQPGLASRKRMHQSYQITSQNDVERQGGNRDAYITVRGPWLPRIGVDFAEWLGWFGVDG